MLEIGSAGFVNPLGFEERGVNGEDVGYFSFLRVKANERLIPLI